MSDLISRRELIENFRKCYSGHLGMENSDACMTFHGICNVINNTNTVYDVDKVVEELPDDVCEWEKGSSGYVGYPAYYSKCCTTNSNGLEMQTHIISDWKYCPYCGKKIKIVGD